MLAGQLHYSQQMSPTLNHCSDDNTVELYALNRLSPATTDAFEEHLLICPACAARAEEADEYVLLFRTAAFETCLGKG